MDRCPPSNGCAGVASARWTSTFRRHGRSDDTASCPAGAPAAVGWFALLLRDRLRKPLLGRFSGERADDGGDRRARGPLNVPAVFASAAAQAAYRAGVHVDLPCDLASLYGVPFVLQALAYVKQRRVEAARLALPVVAARDLAPSCAAAA